MCVALAAVRACALICQPQFMTAFDWLGFGVNPSFTPPEFGTNAASTSVLTVLTVLTYM